MVNTMRSARSGPRDLNVCSHKLRIWEYPLC